MTFKGLSTTFMASLAVHAAIICSLTLPAGGGNAPMNGPIPIQIDDVRYEKLPKVTRRPAKGIPVPRYTALEAQQTTAASDFQKSLNEKIQAQMKQIRELHEPQPAAPHVASSMTSAELLSDPQKGKIFLGYFSQVKKKIQNIVYQRGSNVYGRGSVCLGFVLDDHGKLERVSVIEKGTNADEVMRDLAKRCLQEAAPFGDFPKNLGPGRIAFNITIFFDSSGA